MENYDIDIDTLNRSLIKSCKRNNTKPIKIIINEIKRKNSYVDFSICDEAFQTMCEYGHLEIAKWFFDKRRKYSPALNISGNDNYAFRMACRNGHLELAKWLIKISGEFGFLIRINDVNNYAFMSASQNNHFEIMEWLIIEGRRLLQYIDIRIDNDIAFRTACKNKHIKLVKLLCSICSDYKVSFKRDIFCRQYIYKWSIDDGYLNTRLKGLVKRQDICGICSNEIGEVYELPCHKNHIICEKCIEELYHLDCKVKCPYCSKIWF